ncbi:MAG: hypothetical protein NTX50_15375 [Candidatus Sumerlaeota bacterium]|nr:hypothetical protein [Candidatus Sumerlaeota bacterium]
MAPARISAPAPVLVSASVPVLSAMTPAKAPEALVAPTVRARRR